MRVINNGGSGVITAREYNIATTTDIKRGAVVKLGGGLVAKAGDTDVVLGIAAESHKGAADALNPRANGTVILVHDNPGIIFEVAAPVFKANGGTAVSGTTKGTVTADSAQLGGNNDAFNGGFVKLKKAVSTSAFGYEGSVKKINDFATATASSVTTKTITIEELDVGAAADGDEFWLFPPVGSSTGVMSLNSDATGIVCTGVAATKLKVVGHDLERNKILLTPADMVRDPA